MGDVACYCEFHEARNFSQSSKPSLVFSILRSRPAIFELWREDATLKNVATKSFSDPIAEFGLHRSAIAQVAAWPYEPSQFLGTLLLKNVHLGLLLLP
jgi:hypothetical protein